MMPIPINLAVEDLLSEAVAKRLLRDSAQPFVIGVVYNRGGYGYLKRTAQGWNNAAKGTPFFLLTDLDDAACPQHLRSSWLSQQLHNNFIFRVAVKEVESWLLADTKNLADFLHIAFKNMPDFPDSLDDPKAVLVRLAAKSARTQIRERIAPKRGTTAKQGRDYNACLTEFVSGPWSSESASDKSPSLLRCKQKLSAFRPNWDT